MIATPTTSRRRALFAVAWAAARLRLATWLRARRPPGLPRQVPRGWLRPKSPLVLALRDFWVGGGLHIGQLIAYLVAFCGISLGLWGQSREGGFLVLGVVALALLFLALPVWLLRSRAGWRIATARVLGLVIFIYLAFFAAVLFLWGLAVLASFSW